MKVGDLVKFKPSNGHIIKKDAIGFIISKSNGWSSDCFNVLFSPNSYIHESDRWDYDIQVVCDKYLYKINE